MPVEENPKPKETASPTAPKKLLSEMTDEEVDALSPQEMGRKIAEQAVHNLRHHIPDGLEPASPRETGPSTGRRTGSV